jgi:hypothetical protein
MPNEPKENAIVRHQREWAEREKRLRVKKYREERAARDKNRRGEKFSPCHENIKRN